MTTGAQEVNDRGRASTSFCRRQSRIIDSRGTLTSKDPYEHCATNNSYLFQQALGNH